MKQWKVKTPVAIVYASASLAAAQLETLPQGLFVDGVREGSWVKIETVGYVLVRCLEPLS